MTSDGAAEIQTYGGKRKMNIAINNQREHELNDSLYDETSNTPYVEMDEDITNMIRQNMDEDMQMGRKILVLIAAIATPLLVGAFSAFLTMGDMNIYESLGPVFLSPPRMIFPIAWTVLYVLMGLASYVIYLSDADPAEKRKAQRLYAIQLGMNLFWSTLFFTYGQYFISLLWIQAMWVVTLFCIVRFYNIRKFAGFLMVPLILWTSFATYLNVAYFYLHASLLR